MSNKIRLLFIPYTATNGGGAEKVLALLVNNLNSQKYDIQIKEIRQYNNKIEFQKYVKFEEPFINNKRDIISKISHRITLFFLLHFPVILKKIYRLNCDVVISFNYQLPSFMFPAFKKEKKIAWFHGSINDLNEHGKEKHKKKQEIVWRDADAIVTISNNSLQSLENLFPEFINKSHIVHNGIDSKEVLRLSNEKCDFIFDDLPIIICVGRLDKNKNFSLAIEALSELHKRGIACRLLILGQGELENNYKSLAKTLGVENYVHLIGYKTNPYPYIKKSKVMCITSFSEGFPTVVIESLALGIPFVTTPVAGASEELSAGGRCGLVSDYLPIHYSNALEKLLTDNVLYNQMKNNCLEHVKEYSVEQYVAGFENVLLNVGVKND